MVNSTRLAPSQTDNLQVAEPAPATGRPPRVTAAVKRVAGLGLLLILVGTLASSDSLHEIILRLVEPAERIIVEHPRLGVTLFIVFSALSAMIAFFSTALSHFDWGEVHGARPYYIGVTRHRLRHLTASDYARLQGAQRPRRPA